MANVMYLRGMTLCNIRHIDNVRGPHKDCPGLHAARVPMFGSRCAGVYNVRKLDFQANLCEAFAEDRKQRYCGDLNLG